MEDRIKQLEQEIETHIRVRFEYAQQINSLGSINARLGIDYIELKEFMFDYNIIPLLKTWSDFEEEWYETHLDDSECEPDLEDYKEITYKKETLWLHKDNEEEYNFLMDKMKGKYANK